MPTRTIRLELPAEQAVDVNADADRIGQVVTNYVSNALKYTPAAAAIAVGVQTEGAAARVWVRDEGPGLSADDLERVWDRFYRSADAERHDRARVGLGLGLYICRTIVERHQGHVGVESVLGQGSTFWFTLPLAAPHGTTYDALPRTLAASGEV